MFILLSLLSLFKISLLLFKTSTSLLLSMILILFSLLFFSLGSILSSFILFCVSFNFFSIKFFSFFLAFINCKIFKVPSLVLENSLFLLFIVLLLFRSSFSIILFWVIMLSLSFSFSFSCSLLSFINLILLMNSFFSFSNFIISWHFSAINCL